MAVARSLSKVMMAVTLCSNMSALTATAKLIPDCYILCKNVHNNIIITF